MDNGRNDVLISGITDQLPELYLAELVQVADFIKGLKTARKLLASTETDK